MPDIEIIAQIIGVFAMAMNCLSYQQRSKVGILLFQLIGSALFAVNFFMLGAYSGAILNVVAIIRAFVFIKKDFFRAEHPAWAVAFSVTYVLSYALVFTALGKEATPYNFIVEILPVIAMIVTTVGFRFKSAKALRRFGFVSSPLWLCYNVCSVAVGAIICEAINIVSLVIATVRFDLKKKENEGDKGCE